jgi:multidrug efflux pump subunit AcrB
VPDVNKVDILGEQPQKILHRVQPHQARDARRHTEQIFESVAKQNAIVAGGSVDTAADRVTSE